MHRFWSGLLISSVLVTKLAADARAAEGMFLLDKLPVERLKASGLKIDPGELQKLSKAVVQVARGGTGAFVSPRGLVVTNHHVAYLCLARLGSRKKHLGLLDRGYVARAVSDELPCPGYDMLVVEGVRDVTEKVLAAVDPKAHWSKRFEAIRLRKEGLVEACEAGKKHVCQVAAMDGGNSYLLSTYRRIRDVRLVYAPPKALGKYGGDVDNWIYPRHTADFTFLRAYVDAKGHGAPYAKANVPISTPVHLAISPYGVKRGSLSLVLGFPGRTSRHVTSYAVRFYSEDYVPATLELVEGLIKVLHKRMKASADSKRRYAAVEASLQNALKYYRMSLQGMRRWKVLERKLAEEKALGQSLRDDAGRLNQLRSLLQRTSKVYQRYKTYHRKHLALKRLARRVCPSVALAYKIVRWGREKSKPDRMRKEQAYKDKNIYRLFEASERLEREIELETEKAILLYFLRETEKLPARQRLKSTAKLMRWERRQMGRYRGKEGARRFQETFGVAPSKDRLENAVNMIYAKTQLLARGASPEQHKRARKMRARLLKMKLTEIAKLPDPLLAFARDLEAELNTIQNGPYKEVEQYLMTVLHPRWVKEVKRPNYPDANFTVRLTFGSVRDYTATATGKVHRYITSVGGMLAKDKGAFPFHVPERFKRVFKKRQMSRYLDRQIKDIPVNFTTTLDTTGGNSGSPVLDDKGRLVGLLFDGTPESILSDWQYRAKEQRSICVDIRLALYLARLERAERLLLELGFK